jgi:hypothetical protein
MMDRPATVHAPKVVVMAPRVTAHRLVETDRRAMVLAPRVVGMARRAMAHRPVGRGRRAKAPAPRVVVMAHRLVEKAQCAMAHHLDGMDRPAMVHAPRGGVTVPRLVVTVRRGMVPVVTDRPAVVRADGHTTATRSLWKGWPMRRLRALLVSSLLPGCLVFDGGDDGFGGDWLERTPSPCGFNRMDALHVDDDGTIWTGCGTNTEGFGLFRSVDDGASWAMVDPPNARDFFADYRVNTISRSADGRVYVGGTGGGVMVLALDDDDTATVILEAGDQVGTSFTVGHFRRDSAGRALAESLTGTDTLTRATDADAFAASGVFADGVSHQILDVTLDGDTVHAVGSTIGEPNLYFRETVRDAQPIAFDVVELSGGALGFDGELRAVAARDGVVVVGGVDEAADQAVLHVVSGDDVASIRVADVIAGLDRSTVRGACAGPGLFVVVGEETVTDGRAFVLTSRDAGTTWQDVTPELPTVPSALTRCTITDRITVAGGGGAVLQGPLD